MESFQNNILERIIKNGLREKFELTFTQDSIFEE